jgi:hypothetical protein
MMTMRAAFSFIGGSTPVGRALDRQPRLMQDVGVDHGGGDIEVAEQLLRGADVVAGFEQMGSEGVDGG